MRKAGSNCTLRKVPVSFPYLRVLMQGRPEHGKEDPKHPPMERGHRAKIFARCPRSIGGCFGFSSLCSGRPCISTRR